MQRQKKICLKQLKQTLPVVIDKICLQKTITDKI